MTPAVFFCMLITALMVPALVLVFCDPAPWAGPR